MAKIKGLKDGPYLVENSGGTWKLRIQGQEKALEQSVLALCRCGHSKNKPFCDGSHKAAGFQAEAFEITTD